MRRPSDRTILRYVDQLAAELRLSGWRFELSATPTEPEHWATIAVQRGSAEAVLAVDADLFRQPADQQRHYLVHELAHVILAPLDWSYEDTAESLGVRARKLASKTWDQRSERVCDDFARLLAPGCSLPPWGVR